MRQSLQTVYLQLPGLLLCYQNYRQDSTHPSHFLKAYETEKSKRDTSISIHPLSFDEAIEALVNSPKSEDYPPEASELSLVNHCRLVPVL